MAREEIIEKLNRFLQKKSFDEECHIVYLMVEIRKVLHHENKNKYPLLLFYCDWTVHTEKDRITNEMRAIMEEVFRDVKEQIENPVIVKAMSPIMQFAYMKNLKVEVRQFLAAYHMDTNLLNDKWIQFVSLLVDVLENQPINNPTEDITSFSFLPSAKRCVQGVVVFKEPIKGNNYYKFANAY